jgi:hypothetical protein
VDLTLVTPLPALYRPKVFVDWAADGTFTGPADDVTLDTAADPGIAIDAGRDGSRALNPPKVPSVSFELRNDHRRYSNEYAGSAAYQLVRPGTPISIVANYGESRAYRSATAYRADVPYRGVAVWTLARARLDEASQNAVLGQQRVRINGLGASSVLVGKAVTIPLQTAIRTDQAVALVLDAAGWPAAARAISPGSTTLLYWWADARSAWDLLVELTASEGPGTMYEDADGTFHWEGRGYRSSTARCTTSQAVFGETAAQGTKPYRAAALYRDDARYRGSNEGLYFTALQYQPGWKYVYASATYPTRRRAAGTPGTVVWQYGSTLTLAAGAVQTLFARPADPFTAAFAPTAVTDYVVTAGSATVALTYTSGFLAIVVITAGGSGATITGPAGASTTGIQLRATPLPVASETLAASSIDTTSSQTAYGAVQTLAVAGWPEIDPAMAQGVCNAWVERYRVQRPQVTISVRAADAAHFHEIVARQVSDRITLRSENTGVEGDVWIESREIVMAGAGGRYLEVIWQCEKVDTLVGFVWDGVPSLWDSAIWSS